MSNAVPRQRRLLPAVSVVLLAFVLASWALSHRRVDAVGFFTPGGALQAAGAHRGRVLFFFSDLPFRETRRWSVDLETTDAESFDEVRTILSGATTRRWAFAGFDLSLGAAGALGVPHKSFQLLAVPHWFLAALCAAAPFHVWRRARRRTRWQQAGRCAACGYDLRGIAPGEGGPSPKAANAPARPPARCPECGRRATVALPPARNVEAHPPSPLVGEGRGEGEREKSSCKTSHVD